MSEKAHGSEKSEFTHYDSSETDLNSPPKWTTFPIAQNPEANLPQKRNPKLSSIWVPMRHPCIKQPEVPIPGMIMYYAPHKSMTLYFPKVPSDGAIFCSQRVGNVLILGSVSRIAPWEHRGLHSSGNAVDEGLYCVHETDDGVLLLKTSNDVLTSRKKNSTFTSYDPDHDIAVHCTTVPKDGDIFYSQQNDNVRILSVVPTKTSLESLSQNSSPYPRNINLFHVEEKYGAHYIESTGDDIFSFQEENRTATYYLPEKDIALHFTRIPRDGDIFCSQHSGNVVVLDILPAETSQGHPWDKDLYRVHGRHDGFLLVKLDSNNMLSEESFFIGEKHHDYENATFTCYLHSLNLAFHFNRAPTHDDLFESHLKNNIMILELRDQYFDRRQPFNAHQGLFDIGYYRVQQRDAGFKLVKVKAYELVYPPGFQWQSRLKIRRYIASSPCSDEEDKCVVCLVAYKNFDRIGRLNCGHEYHVSCIMRWLPQKNVCPCCRGEAVSIQVPPKYSYLDFPPPSTSPRVINRPAVVGRKGSA